MFPSPLEPDVPRVIYSLGTGQRSFAQFVSLLKDHRIEVGIDVRRFPTSRFPHFSREALSASLEDAGIQYVYLGKALGGFRKEGYLRYMERDTFREGLMKLEEIAREKRAAFFCSETFPWKCHRRWIAREMVRRRWEVIHLLDGGRVWIPRGHPEKKD